MMSNNVLSQILPLKIFLDFLFLLLHLDIIGTYFIAMKEYWNTREFYLLNQPEIVRSRSIALQQLPQELTKVGHNWELLSTEKMLPNLMDLHFVKMAQKQIPVSIYFSLPSSLFSSSCLPIMNITNLTLINL